MCSLVPFKVVNSNKNTTVNCVTYSDSTWLSLTAALGHTLQRCCGRGAGLAVLMTQKDAG